MIKTPILENNQYSFLSAGYSTGIVLTTNFKRFIGSDKKFHIFSNYEQALEFIDNKISENSNLEFSIYNSKREYLYTKDKNVQIDFYTYFDWVMDKKLENG